MKREEIGNEYKWNLLELYENIDEYNKDLKSVLNYVEELYKYKGIIYESENTLLEALELYEKINMITSSLYVYSNMSLHLDTTDSFYQELTGNLDITLSKISEKISFFVPEILSVPFDFLLNYISKNNELDRFKFYLEQIFKEKEHVLSEKEEELLSRGANVLGFSDNLFSNLNEADIIFDNIEDDGKELELTKASYYKYITSNNREIRKKAFMNLYKKYKELNNTFASIMNFNLQTTNFNYKTRKYNSTLNMFLDGNNIDINIYKNLIETINNNLSKIHKYFEIRKKILGYDELHMYDLSVNLIKESNKEYDYETAKELVIESLSILGDKYKKDLEISFNNNWIDVYETKNKRSGAYSWGAYPKHPFVLLNYQGKLNDVSTLAHELGHAMHRYYSNELQDYLYSDNEIFVAEIASTVNELLLKFHMLDNSKDVNEKLNIINELLDDVKNTIFRQTMFAEFELLIHEITEKGESLSSNRLNDMYYELVKKYHGNSVFVDEEIKYEWSRIPHFYTPFYVYQYATGLSIAFNIANKIYNKDSDMLDKYLKFLGSGSSDYPTNLVDKMGINIKESISGALEIFDKYLNEFNDLT